MKSYIYSRDQLLVLDQLKLPMSKEYIGIQTVEDAWRVIKDMNVRGAPLIAVIAALGLTVDALSKKETFDSVEAVKLYLIEKMVYLRTSRPTAVNLFKAMDQLEAGVNRFAPEAKSATELLEAFACGAESIMEEDLAANRELGKHGASLIHAQNPEKKTIKVLTICNTGSLATGGYGTALGIVRSLHESSSLEQVYACETRPYNQGTRLTAYELVEDRIPGTLICDSMASFLMQTKGVDCVVVGADRVVANGDTANKIGTYQLAVVAKYHNVPFIVAAPTSSLDPTKKTGAEIEIEERPASEITHLQGHQIAPEGITVWNPAFDVTPGALITAIVTEKGVIYPCQCTETGANVFDVAGFLEHLADSSIGLPSVPLKYGFYQLTTQTVPHYLLSIPRCRDLFGTDKLDELTVQEMGDGNLNYIYVVRGPGGAAVVKQALPYVRCVGESWPLSVSRSFFEYEALKLQHQLVPELVPEVFHFNRDLAVIVMQFIEPPHIMLRKALIEGLQLPALSDHIATFLAKTLFFTSSLHLTGPEKRVKVAKWLENHGLCALSERVIFTEPYITHQNNRWTSPQLDADVSKIQDDRDLKLAISRLKELFQHSAEALIHGDLHTGSFMVKPGSTLVIDPEFAFYGPMGFDIGAVVGNFVLAYISQAAHNNGEAYADWILGEVESIWVKFSEKFLDFWNEEKYHFGDSYHRGLFAQPEELLMAQTVFMRKLLSDSLGFAGAKMIRRIIGIAHVEDLESIQDADRRADCERLALKIARELVVNGSNFPTIQQVILYIKSMKSSLYLKLGA